MIQLEQQVQREAAKSIKTQSSGLSIPDIGRKIGGLFPSDCDGVKIFDRCIEFGGGNGGGGDLAPCPAGTVRVGKTCVSPGDAFPGGKPMTFGAGGGAVVGAFGIPGISPTRVDQPVLRCPDGMVLGKDNVCYPRQVLGARGQFRKWKAPKKPPMTAADAAALRRIGTLQNRVKKLAKTAGFKSCKK